MPEKDFKYPANPSSLHQNIHTDKKKHFKGANQSFWPLSPDRIGFVTCMPTYRLYYNFIFHCVFICSVCDFRKISEVFFFK